MFVVNRLFDLLIICIQFVLLPVIITVAIYTDTRAVLKLDNVVSGSWVLTGYVDMLLFEKT